MPKKIQTGTDLHVLYANRIRHAIVKTVTDQDNIEVEIGRETTFSATRESSTKTRGFLFEQV
jgi:hypothetical protein